MRGKAIINWSWENKILWPSLSLSRLLALEPLVWMLTGHKNLIKSTKSARYTSGKANEPEQKLLIFPELAYRWQQLVEIERFLKIQMKNSILSIIFSFSFRHMQSKQSANRQEFNFRNVRAKWVFVFRGLVRCSSKQNMKFSLNHNDRWLFHLCNLLLTRWNNSSRNLRA